MTNDEILAAVIRLIKAGKKEAAQSILEPFLLENPSHIQGWMWKAELFTNDSDKVHVLEACLQQNPGNPQVIQALTFLKNRSGKSAATPVPTSPFRTDKPTSTSPSPFSSSPTASPFEEQSFQKPAPPPFDESSAAKSSPFSSAPFSNEWDASLAKDQQAKAALPLPPQFDSAEAKQIPTREKKPKGKRSRTADIFIIAGVCLIFALLVGGYVGGGFYLNGQINAAFAQQQCKSVVGYNSFAALYPQGIFSSTFTGYDQYAECRLKLDADQALKAKDWASAVTLAQQYLASYPGGSFSANMHDQIRGALSAWGKELVVAKNYGSGIDKLEQLVEAYPTDPAAESARAEIQQAYLDWAKEFTDKQSYAEAEQNLKKALTYFQADSARTAQIKAELVNVYVDWGDMLVGIGNLDKALTYYKLAGEVSQGGTDINLLIAKAYLKQATEMADKNDFDHALVKVQEVADTAQAENVKTLANTARGKILAAYSASNSLIATEQITAAISLICSGGKPELPIFGLDKKNIRFGLVTLIPTQLPKDLAAETPGQLHYVACTVEKETEIGTCPYTGGLTLHRMRYEWEVTLYEVATGIIFKTETLKGSSPPACKPTELFTKGVNYKKSYGGKPTVDQIVAWFKELNITK